LHTTNKEQLFVGVASGQLTPATRPADPFFWGICPATGKAVHNGKHCKVIMNPIHHAETVTLRLELCKGKRVLSCAFDDHPSFIPLFDDLPKELFAALVLPSPLDQVKLTF